jgi:hypothetical protein
VRGDGRGKPAVLLGLTESMDSSPVAVNKVNDDDVGVVASFKLVSDEIERSAGSSAKARARPIESVEATVSATELWRGKHETHTNRADGNSCRCTVISEDMQT